MGEAKGVKCPCCKGDGFIWQDPYVMEQPCLYCYARGKVSFIKWFKWNKGE